MRLRGGGGGGGAHGQSQEQRHHGLLLQATFHAWAVIGSTLLSASLQVALTPASAIYLYNVDTCWGSTPSISDLKLTQFWICKALGSSPIFNAMVLGLGKQVNG